MSEAIRKRLVEIEAELFARSAYLPADILRRPDPKAQLAREEHHDALRRERRELLMRLPPTGEASGMHLVMNRTLGTVYVRASEPYQPPDDGYDMSDPNQKFAKEMGWSID